MRVIAQIMRRTLSIVFLHVTIRIIHILEASAQGLYVITRRARRRPRCCIVRSVIPVHTSRQRRVQSKQCSASASIACEAACDNTFLHFRCAATAHDTRHTYHLFRAKLREHVYPIFTQTHTSTAIVHLTPGTGTVKCCYITRPSE